MLFIQPIRIGVISILSSFAMASNAMAATNWQSAVESAEHLYSKGDIAGTNNQFVAALQGAQKAKVASSDPTMKKLLYDDIPTAILYECYDRRQPESAKGLAQWRMYTVQQMYGADCVPYIDAEMDMMIVYKALKDEPSAQQALADVKQRSRVLGAKDPEAAREAAKLMLRKDQMLLVKIQNLFAKTQTMLEKASR
jgi:hypothetical protein